MAIRNILNVASADKESIDQKTWQHMMKHTLSAGCHDDAEYEDIMKHVWMAH
jgi:hypothetical protein